jgi:hypothetical protein
MHFISSKNYCLGKKKLETFQNRKEKIGNFPKWERKN